MNDKFEKEIESIINKTNNMGIIEFAIQEAAQEAAQEASEQTAQQVRTEMNTSFVKRLLLKGKLTLEEIADAAEVSMEFVRSVKMQLY